MSPSERQNSTNWRLSASLLLHPCPNCKGQHCACAQSNNNNTEVELSVAQPAPRLRHHHLVSFNYHVEDFVLTHEHEQLSIHAMRRTRKDLLEVIVQGVSRSQVRIAWAASRERESTTGSESKNELNLWEIFPSVSVDFCRTKPCAEYGNINLRSSSKRILFSNICNTWSTTSDSRIRGAG